MRHFLIREVPRRICPLSHGAKGGAEDTWIRVLGSGSRVRVWGLQGYLAHKKVPPIGPYSMTMPRVL